MKRRLSVLVTGAAPDAVNNNAFLRSMVAEGFASILGEEDVVNVPFAAAGAAVKDFAPAFVLCFGSCMPDSSFLEYVANVTRSRGGTFGVWLHDDPYEFDFRYRATSCADLIFSNDAWAVQHYEHDRVFHLPLAASPARHYRPINGHRLVDLYFCGVAFPNRVGFFRDLPPAAPPVQYLVEGTDWPADIPYARSGRVDNEHVTDMYSRSLAVLNIGRHFDLANSHYALTPSTPGPRTFEAAMAGAAQLFVVESLEIIRYFTPRTEIILVDSVRDVPDIVRDLRRNEGFAIDIARAAQARALRDHCYANRARRIVEVLRESLGIALGDDRPDGGAVAAPTASSVAEEVS
jgi:spore maturation protein CgeB